jgi:peptide/nickel transport system ATP-binding protein
MKQAVLDIRDLHVAYGATARELVAVRGVSLRLAAGERFGLVGESGSGKSTMIMAVLRLLKPPARVTAGAVLMDGTDLLQLSEPGFRRLRLTRLALVPQGAMDGLNPVLRVGRQMTLAMAAHGRRSGRDVRERTKDLLEQVGLPGATADRFPHELSGGMKQRVCIAMAMALEPRVIFADEPTSALDVVVQRRTMQTLYRLQQTAGATVLLVGHDMGLMAQFTERIGIMYAGRLVEVGPTGDMFRKPLHPYTRLLISSVPTFERRGGMQGIPGSAPSLVNPVSGCPFHPRCPDAEPACREAEPPLRELGGGRAAACRRLA